MGTDQSIAEWHLQNWARWMRRGDAVTKGYPDKSIGFSPANTVGADYWEIMCSDEDDKSARICWTIIKDDLPPMISAILQSTFLNSVHQFPRLDTEEKRLAAYNEAVAKFWRIAQGKGLS